MGTLSHSVGTEPCIYWNETGIPDEYFPDGSATDAKNYCRNPELFAAPYCYTDQQTKEFCDVAYCGKFIIKLLAPRATIPLRESLRLVAYRIWYNGLQEIYRFQIAFHLTAWLGSFPVKWIQQVLLQHDLITRYDGGSKFQVQLVNLCAAHRFINGTHTFMATWSAYMQYTDVSSPSCAGTNTRGKTHDKIQNDCVSYFFHDSWQSLLFSGYDDTFCSKH